MNPVTVDGEKGIPMALAPSPLNPDHGLDKRPRLEDTPAFERWISRRYGISLPLESVAEIIADNKDGSALRHRLRWAFIHDRWTLFLSKNGLSEPQSQECEPVNGSTPYTWARHVHGVRTPAPVYPGEPWDVDPSFAHVVKNGPRAGVYWDAAVEPGFATWAHERYGLAEDDILRRQLTHHRHPSAQHASLPQVIGLDLTPEALYAHRIAQLWLNTDNVIVDRDGRELPVTYVPVPQPRKALFF